MTWATNNSINCYHSSDLSVKTHSRWKTCPMQFLNGLICWYVKQISSLAGAKDSHRFSSCEQINSNAKQSQLQHGHQVCLQTNGLQSEMWGRLKKKKREKAFCTLLKHPASSPEHFLSSSWQSPTKIYPWKLWQRVWTGFRDTGFITTSSNCTQMTQHWKLSITVIPLLSSTGLENERWFHCWQWGSTSGIEFGNGQMYFFYTFPIPRYKCASNVKL